MMRHLLLKTHYTADEAYSILMLLDELRDAIWNNYREEIIEYCHQHTTQEGHSGVDIEDDIIPF